jgi:hypothetical protein
MLGSAESLRVSLRRHRQRGEPSRRRAWQLQEGHTRPLHPPVWKPSHLPGAAVVNESVARAIGPAALAANVKQGTDKRMGNQRATLRLPPLPPAFLTRRSRNPKGLEAISSRATARVVIGDGAAVRAASPLKASHVGVTATRNWRPKPNHSKIFLDRGRSRRPGQPALAVARIFPDFLANPCSCSRASFKSRVSCPSANES